MVSKSKQSRRPAPVNCPECNEKPETIEIGGRLPWQVYCARCGVEGPSTTGEVGAIELWNRRNSASGRARVLREQRNILAMARAANAKHALDLRTRRRADAIYDRVKDAVSKVDEALVAREHAAAVALRADREAIAAASNANPDPKARKGSEANFAARCAREAARARTKLARCARAYDRASDALTVAYVAYRKFEERPRKEQ